MMREIKFRVWSNTTKEWIKSSEVYLRKDGIPFVNTISNGISGMYEADLILIQYTGLKDKNGKEIYEGDIILKKGYEEGLGKVYYCETGMGFFIELIKGYRWAFHYSDGPNWHRDELEIIGNIYENPELLK
jgi:uncharacterized phage protein (TIGR01671 family)